MDCPFIFFISLRRQKGAHELYPTSAEEGCSTWVEGDTGHLGGSLEPKSYSIKLYCKVLISSDSVHPRDCSPESNHRIQTNIYVGGKARAAAKQHNDQSCSFCRRRPPARRLISFPSLSSLTLSPSPFGANSVMLSSVRPSPSSFIRILPNEWCCTTSCGYSVCQLAP